jgi:hypothetical protein
MNINDILAQQQKLLDKAKTGMAAKKIAQADIAQPIDPGLITIQTVFETVKGTGSSAATAARYQAAIAQRAPQIAQLRQGVSQDVTLKAAVTSTPKLALKSVAEALEKCTAVRMPQTAVVQPNPTPQKGLAAALPKKKKPKRA